HAERLTLADRLRLFDRVCDTIAFAHARSIVHRDLKPANIMVGPFGDVRVLDWGLACSRSDPVSGDSGTAAGKPVTQIAGTEGYMAPEQTHGRADERSDVYALGAILRGLVGSTERRALRPLQAIVMRATADDPGDRYAEVPSLAADVRRFID